MRRGNPAQLEIVEFDVGTGADGYYYSDHTLGISAVAISPEIPEPVKQACAIQAHAHHTRRPPKGGRKFMLEVRDVEDLDPNAILAIRSVIEDLRPSWVEEVKDACRIADHPRVIADWCELSIAVVVAILENLRARGELPRG